MIVKGSPSYAKNIVRSRVCTLTPFFLNLYSRLSLTFAITASFYMLLSPQYAFARSSQMV